MTNEMTGWDRTEVTQKLAETIDFKQSKSETKYLPAGSDWYYYWTETKYKGGQDVRIETKFDEVPMFVKAGSILPIAPVMMYAEESRWDDLEIVIYPGADATFTLYEDEGDNYNYENGAYSTITFRWNDRNGRLTIDAVSGEYPGMLTERLFRVRLAGNDETVKVNYSGKSVTIAM